MSLFLKIADRIGKSGPITFEAFMDMALYERETGYYASEDTEIGRAGDFYTSPHLHRIFGAMLGRQVEEFWLALGRPRCFDVIEMGGGRGHLAKDMLDYLKGRDVFNSLRYTLVELNPHLAKRQRELLSGYSDRVRWASSLSELATRPLPHCCLLSNELVDAFPVHLITMEDGLREIYVSLGEDGLIETPGPLSSGELGDYLEEFSVKLERGARTEINLRMRGWLEEVSGLLGEGFLLTIDYGYPAWELHSEERTRGTLLCYHKHTYHEDPLANVGRQDITSHVNFSALKMWGERMGLKAIGYCSQGAYLVSLGIDEVISEFLADGRIGPEDMSKIKGLIMPGSMGDTHKVLTQYKGSGMPPSLRGFEMKNRLKSL